MYKRLAVNYGTILISFMLFFVCIIGSNDVNSKEQKNLKSILETSFEDIYLAKGGLEYPHTEDQPEKVY